MEKIKKYELLGLDCGKVFSYFQGIENFPYSSRK